MRSVTFTIEGMACQSCGRSIEMLLSAEPGVRAAAVSFEEKEARILYEPAATDAARLAALVERLGFRATARA